MKETLFTYVYRSAIGVMLASALLVLFVQNTAPFGLSTSWSEEGFGSSLVVTRPLGTAVVGSSVVRSAELKNEVSVYTVAEVLRRDGTMYYQLTDASTPDTLTVPAVELGRTALVSVPLIGVFVQMLSHTIGAMTLMGLPLLMLGINYTMMLVQKVVPTLALLETSAKRNEEKRVDTLEEERPIYGM